MRLGQHMVVDRSLIRRIVEYAELDSSDAVLEVGCGTGNLTAAILENCRVIGIEKDGELVRMLENRFRREIESGRFMLIRGDALKVDFPPFTKIVSNIPYEISSPLLFKLFRYRFESAVLMLQREFAERLCGEDSRLGVIAKARCKAEILEFVGRESFKPMPRVESAVVRIVPRPEVEVRNLELFEKFVTFAFSMRRKKIGKIAREFERRFGLRVNLDRETAEKRPEEIGAKVFARIADDIRTR
ncbi:MAG: ribosomal RNA small subunit methyltransferase A [Archaeoglobales archaeon]|nr:ribosomal RNA small subunit methyltransferase A [Archaeoglobales archaeon]